MNINSCYEVLQPCMQNTAVLAYSVNNQKYDRHIKRVLSKINQDKNITSVHICLACTLQRWNKMLEGYGHEEALLLSQKDGDVIEAQVDGYARGILGEKYKGIVRWYSYANHNEYLKERNKFNILCKKDVALNILYNLINCSNREDLLRNECNVRKVFDKSLQEKEYGKISWETAMAASIFDYTVSIIKKNSPQKKPEMYKHESFIDLLNMIFSNCYEYLAEELIIAYKFWDYNRLLYFGKITPVLSKAHEEFILKSGAGNKLWWQEIKLIDNMNTEELIKNRIDFYLKSQKLQVKKDHLSEFTISITSLLKAINEVPSKEIKYVLKLLATHLITIHEQVVIDGEN